ncbi:MAG: hypothetical protein JSV46_00720 [Candidatus Aminicenantes bacterium]|nr:MAG: hypothetical protein JSV46_00720 [Candidatus Aminicenantes bacterium]
MEQLNMKALEKKAFRSFFKDGIYDVFLGLILFSFGLPMMLNEFGWIDYETMTWPLVFALTLNVGALLFFVFGKKYITVPRLGFVRFGKGRKRKMRHVKLLLVISALIGLVIFFLVLFKVIPVGGETGVPPVGLIFGFQALIVFSLAAYFMDFTRLYLYAFLFGVSLPLTFWLKDNDVLAYPSLYVFSFTAGPMLVIGWILFFRFLRQYPKKIEQGAGGE